MIIKTFLTKRVPVEIKLRFCEKKINIQEKQVDREAYNKCAICIQPSLTTEVVMASCPHSKLSGLFNSRENSFNLLENDLLTLTGTVDKTSLTLFF